MADSWLKLSEPGEVLQRHYGSLVDIFGKDEFSVIVLGTFLLTNAIFWIVGALFMILDVSGRPSVLLKYKVQPDKNCPVTSQDLMRAVKVVVTNQICVGGPFIVGFYYITRWRGSPWSAEDCPSGLKILFDLCIFTVVEEAGFYYSHRLFHHPRLYKHIHKMHHEWTAPIGIVAMYAHPLEHLVANLMPLALGPIILGSHLVTIWLFWTLAVITTVVHHSGYHLPLLPSPEAHDYHHLKFNTNYGVTGWLDRLHGTDKMFRSSTAYRRHFILLSPQPASELFPEPARKKL